jgi:hypothetical protein
LSIPDIVLLLPDKYQETSQSFIMAQTTTLKEFESIFPTLVEDLLAHGSSYGAPKLALDWYKAVRKLSITL